MEIEPPNPPTQTPLVNPDEWDQVWAGVHETLYHSYYEEFVLEALLERWERASAVSRFVVTVTAPGSAISGWALWNTPGFKYLWAIVAGLGALFAVLEAVLSMNDKIKEHTLLLIEFRSLRTDLQTFKTIMSIKALSGLQAYKDAFLVLRERFSKASSKLRNDLWYTNHVESVAQARLDLVFSQ